MSFWKKVAAIVAAAIPIGITASYFGAPHLYNALTSVVAIEGGTTVAAVAYVGCGMVAGLIAAGTIFVVGRALYKGFVKYIEDGNTYEKLAIIRTVVSVVKNLVQIAVVLADKNSDKKDVRNNRNNDFGLHAYRDKRNCETVIVKERCL